MSGSRLAFGVRVFLISPEVVAPILYFDLDLGDLGYEIRQVVRSPFKNGLTLLFAAAPYLAACPCRGPFGKTS